MTDRYPAHALAEIEANPDMAEWWERWALVGDAKAALEEARKRLAASADEWMACRLEAGATTPGPDCACGGCQDRHLRLRAEREEARLAVLAAEQAFKEQQ